VSKGKFNKSAGVSSRLMQKLKKRLPKQGYDKQISEYHHTNGDSDKGETIEVGTWSNAREYVSQVEYLIPGWVPYGMLTLIVGESSVGKSTLVLYGIVRSVLTGCRSFTGSAGPPTSPVLWCDTESRMGANLKRADELTMSIEGIITPFPEELRSFKIDNDENLERLEKIITQNKTKLVVIDTLNGSHSMSENDPRIAGPLYSIATIAERTGAAILFTHHTRKQGGTFHEEMTLHSIRGSSAIAAVPTSVIGIERLDKRDDWLKIHSLKHNLDRKPEPIGMKIHTERLEFGEAPQLRRKETKKQDCTEWLSSYLISGSSFDSSSVIQAGEDAGYSRSTIQRARAELGVKVILTRKEGKRSGAKWKLP
jgi:hypothetical protein